MPAKLVQLIESTYATGERTITEWFTPEGKFVTRHDPRETQKVEAWDLLFTPAQLKEASAYAHRYGLGNDDISSLWPTILADAIRLRAEWAVEHQANSGGDYDPHR